MVDVERKTSSPQVMLPCANCADTKTSKRRIRADSMVWHYAVNDAPQLRTRQVMNKAISYRVALALRTYAGAPEETTVLTMFMQTGAGSPGVTDGLNDNDTLRHPKLYQADEKVLINLLATEAVEEVKRGESAHKKRTPGQVRLIERNQDPGDAALERETTIVEPSINNSLTGVAKRRLHTVEA